jgi:hypothetical protein
MKIPKETTFLIIIGLFLLSYLLEAVVDPLNIRLATPYAYFSPANFLKYPFTTATVIIRSISIFMTPIFLLSFIPKSYYAKLGIVIVVSALSQLYSLQGVASDTTLMPMEWSLSLTLAGLLLALPAIIYITKGLILSAKAKIIPEETPEEMTQTEE